jgi:hypothetical protein
MLLKRPFRSLADTCENTYEIENSFMVTRNNTAYLAWTPSSAGNRRVYTISFWIKIPSLYFDVVRSPTIFGAIDGSGGIEGPGIGAGNSNALVGRMSFFGITGSGSQSFTNYLLTNGTWQHLVFKVDTTQTDAEDRAQGFVNGIRAEFNAGTIPQNRETLINSANEHNIGFTAVDSVDFELMYSDFYFIDGEALDPTEFGFFDNRGVWIPKAYGGSYGSNGFYLKFDDPNNLGADSSGNNNNWTGVNVTSNNQISDNPYRQYMVLNTQQARDNLDYRVREGSLEFYSVQRTNSSKVLSNVAILRGKWYCEIEVGAVTSSGVGIISSETNGQKIGGIGANDLGYAIKEDGNKFHNGVSESYGAAWQAGDIIQIALDMDNKKVWFGINGTWQDSSDPENGTNPAYDNLPHESYFFGIDRGADADGVVRFTANFGQRDYTYTAPNGFEGEINNFNLQSQYQLNINNPSNYFDIVTYTGNGSTQDITGLNFQPDIVWIKSTSTTTGWRLVDSVRGVGNAIVTNDGSLELSEADGVTAFLSDGFSLGNDSNYNANGEEYVAYCYRRAPEAGLDIITYTGNGTSQAIAHNLGKAPDFMLAKDLDAANPVRVFHKDIPDAADRYLNLSTTQAVGDISPLNLWDNTLPDENNVYVAGNTTNQNGNNYVIFVWTGVEGFSKFDAYEGNRDQRTTNVVPTNVVYLDFEPLHFMLKRLDGSGGSYGGFDSERSPLNPQDKVILFNEASAETTEAILNTLMFSNNNCTVYGTGGLNIDGSNYMYASWARNNFIDTCNITAGGK